MIELLEAARDVQDFCGQKGWRFCFIWGAVLTGFGGEDEVIDALLARFAPRLPGAREFAQRNRVLFLNTANAIGIGGQN
jgi:hypothetical protein